MLVACDRDLGDLLFYQRLPPPPAVLYVRFEPEDVREIVSRLLAVLEADDLTDHMMVINDRQVRRRPFKRMSKADE